jgi:predicted SAM-dependent methyltransferase
MSGEFIEVPISEQPVNCGVADSKSLLRLLNLGCGLKRREHYLNVDVMSQVNPDLVWDLDQYPYPLPRSYFEQIHAGDVIEHLQNIPDFMREMHALLAPGGVIEITTPHFSCANSYTDPTHRHHLGYFSFDYFTDQHELSYYTDVRFEIVHRHIGFHNSFMNRFVRKLANLYPHQYEQRFTWIFPAWFLGFELRAIK